MYFSGKRDDNLLRWGRKKARKEIASEFILNMENFPHSQIYYISVSEISGDRFNMLARNQTGQLMAYYHKSRKVKKNGKITRFFWKVKKPTMAVILDKTTSSRSPYELIMKLTEFVNEFIFVFESLPSDVVNAFV
jgi:orotate phosphoribosyltransferase-like protein